ncbi:hypothetical protein NB706_003674 [Xanthomonas sacchari]|nr:hypothetical protein [Xanthomonas sacchari]
MGAGGSGVPAPGAGHLPAHRPRGRREPGGARALHRGGQEDPVQGAGRAGPARGDQRAAQAHLQHLAEDAEEAPGLRPAVRPARGAGDGRRRRRLLCRAGRGARAVGAGAQRVRRLHRPAQGQRLPLAAHRRGRPGRAHDRGADPYPRHARAGRAGRGCALEVQGRRQGRGEGLRPQDHLDAPVAGAVAGRRAGRAGRGAGRRAGRGPGLCLDPDGRGDRPAAGRHAAGFRLPRAHHGRAPLPRRQGQQPHRAADPQAAQR